MEAIFDFIPTTRAGKECWCSKCKKHRPDAGSVQYVDGHGRRKRACVSCKKYVKAQGMAMIPQPIGNLADDAIRSLSDRIKLRAMSNKARGVSVYVDAKRDVYGLSDDQSIPDAELMGVYNRKARLGDIAADLMMLRNGR